MKFIPENFANKIETKYVTKYGEEIGEVFCKILERDKKESIFNNFKKGIENTDFFDLEKVKQSALSEFDFEFANRAMTSAIIKECKYNEHFMTWDEGIELTNTFLKEFDEIQKIYSNAYWEVIFEDNLHDAELDMTGWDNFSRNYWFDYGFLIVAENKIGIIWFGDES